MRTSTPADDLSCLIDDLYGDIVFRRLAKALGKDRSLPWSDRALSRLRWGAIVISPVEALWCEYLPGFVSLNHSLGMEIVEVDEAIPPGQVLVRFGTPPDPSWPYREELDALTWDRQSVKELTPEQGVPTVNRE